MMRKLGERNAGAAAATQQVLAASLAGSGRSVPGSRAWR